MLKSQAGICLDTVNDKGTVLDNDTPYVLRISQHSLWSSSSLAICALMASVLSFADGIFDYFFFWDYSDLCGRTS